MKRRRKIRALDLLARLFGIVQAIDHGGLDAGEAEVKPFPLVKSRVEPVAVRVSLQRKLLKIWSAGIGQAKYTGNLVKRLACRVIPRPAQ